MFELGKNMSLCGVHNALSSQIVCFTVWNHKLVTGSADSTISIWSDEMKRVHKLEGHRSKVLYICVWDSKMQLISSSTDGCIKFWNESGQCVDTWKHIAWMYNITLWKMYDSSNNNTIETVCSASCNGTLKIWNNKNTLLNASRSSCNTLIVHDNMLWSGYGDGSIVVWHHNCEPYHRQRKGHSGSVNTFCEWKFYVVSGGSDGIIQVWDSHIRPVMSMNHGGNVISAVTWYGNLFSASSTEIKGWRTDGSCMNSVSTVHSFSAVCVWNHFLWAGTTSGKILAFAESRPWVIVRLLWIGHLKEDPKYCDFTKMPKDMIKLLEGYLEYAAS